MEQVCILGSTGSIGENTLEVIARNSEKYHIRSLVAGRNYQGMFRQVKQFMPDVAIMADPEAAKCLAQLVREEGYKTEVLSGTREVARAAAEGSTSIVVAAIVGAAGLLPTLAAVKSGKKVLLANKEALVMTGDLFMRSVEESGAVLLPVDSEHNAIFQCMPPDYRNGLRQVGVRRILLTASGGPFRNRSIETLATVTPEQACAHPNWAMGKKISVDSATMMNKGLEMIEACWLFNARPDQIETVVHPQSIIHSLVDYDDGSVLAQLSNPDMKTPIAQALAWPKRIPSGAKPLSLIEIARLDFQAPSFRRFPCLKLAQEAMSAGGTASAMLNAANEEAVDAFLRKQLRFDKIPEVIDATLQKLPVNRAGSVEDVLDADVQARSNAQQYIIRQDCCIA
ncbi:1-deoxy-D-xylulose 5-phosphate reductoisomerase [invertebrate metagenome]|uniref:1-deoxy-D-xylulose-5-phosphate reductoisomerase n=1 Tax=invertebrate metagenome TaxID=1711999 RepID=A0A2H9T7C7_9ZZZZ